MCLLPGGQGLLAKVDTAIQQYNKDAVSREKLGKLVNGAAALTLYEKPVNEKPKDPIVVSNIKEAEQLRSGFSTLIATSSAQFKQQESDSLQTVSNRMKAFSDALLGRLALQFGAQAASALDSANRFCGFSLAGTVPRLQTVQKNLNDTRLSLQDSKTRGWHMMLGDEAAKAMDQQVQARQTLYVVTAKLLESLKLGRTIDLKDVSSIQLAHMLRDPVTEPLAPIKEWVLFRDCTIARFEVSLAAEVESSLRSYSDFAKHVMQLLSQPLPEGLPETGVVVADAGVTQGIAALLCKEKVLAHGLHRPA